MKCPKCQIENPENKSFCRQCGAELLATCPQCRAKVRPDDEFCGECGEQLTGLVPFADPELATESERKHVTLIFTDLSGYTSMTERLDPEEVKEVMNRIFGEITRVIRKYEGFIERFVGDAVMAVFGVPRAHEDDPVRAIRAAMEIHEIVEGMNLEVQEVVGHPLSMHTGINTGLVVTGEVNVQEGKHGIIGDAINLASRLGDLAQAGEILTGPETYRQAEGFFNFEPARCFRVKGRSEPVQVYKVLSTKRTPFTLHRISGVRASLVGRESEMARLRDAASRLRGEGKGSVFSISGDAGTGKTRLVEEFKASLDPDKFQWLEAYAYSYAQNIPYFPLIDLINRAFHIDEGNTPEEVSDKIRSYTETLKLESDNILLYVGSLYGLESPSMDAVSPDVWKSRLYDSMVEILTALARRASTVFCLEDLHWADPSSIELLRRVLLEFQHPAIVLCIHRPVFSLFAAHQLDRIGRIYHEIKIQDFSPPEAQNLLQSLLRTENIPHDLKQFVHNKAEGNPFYLEELVNSLIESETLISENGGWKITKPIDEVDVSGSIHGVISGRLDRLEHQTKRVLREASVIGRTFLYEILKRITQMKQDIDGCLSGLERLDLIRTRSLQPELEYIFKHALTQEVVYSGLLRTERKEIHERIALVMEQLFQNRISEFYETLAFHFKQGRSMQKAVQYLLKSAEKGLKRYSFEESNLYFKDAFDLTTATHPSTEEEKVFLIDLLLKWAECYHLRGAYRGLIDLLTPYEKLAQSIDDKSRLAMFYGWLGFAMGVREKLNEGFNILRQALSLAESAKNEKVIGYTCGWLAMIAAELGRLDEAVIHGERAKRSSEQFPSDWQLLELAYNGFGTPQFFKGAVAKQMGVSKWVLQDARRRSDPRYMAASVFAEGCAQFLAGDFSSAIKSVQSSIQLSVDPIWSLRAQFILGLAHVKIGQFNQAENIFDEVIETSEKMGTEIWGTSAEALQGLIQISKGHLNKGVTSIENDLQAFLQKGSRYRYATGNCMLGNVYLQIVDRSGPKTISFLAKNIGFLLKNMPHAAKKADYHFNKAIETAKDIGAGGILGEAYMGLGLLHRARKRTGDAKKCISEAIQCFEQCQAETYLKQAKEALASLQ